jgi:hypothetical protein
MEVRLGGLAAHDYGTPTDISVMSGQSYSFTAGIFGSASQFQQGFYGTGLEVRAYYLRSGYAKALQLANFLDEYWITSPEVDGGYAGLFLAVSERRFYRRLCGHEDESQHTTDSRRHARIFGGYHHYESADTDGQLGRSVSDGGRGDWNDGRNAESASRDASISPSAARDERARTT